MFRNIREVLNPLSGMMVGSSFAAILLHRDSLTSNAKSLLGWVLIVSLVLTTLVFVSLSNEAFEAAQLRRRIMKQHQSSSLHWRLHLAANTCIISTAAYVWLTAHALMDRPVGTPTITIAMALIFCVAATVCTIWSTRVRYVDTPQERFVDKSGCDQGKATDRS